MSRGRYIVLDLENLAILETDTPDEIKESSSEYNTLDELIGDAKGYLDEFRSDAWNAYIQYLKEWALSHEDPKHVGDEPDGYPYFLDRKFFNKEGEKDE